MIYRTYQCPNCDQMFEVAHDSGDEPFPDCPTCAKVLEWRPQRIAIGGSAEGKAVKYAQTIMEEDFGLSNYKDNNKEGDVGMIMPSYTKSEDETLMRQVQQYAEQTKGNENARKSFWGESAAAPTTVSSMNGQSMIQMAQVGPKGPDPMALLHKGVKDGKIPTPKQMMRVVGRADK